MKQVTPVLNRELAKTFASMLPGEAAVSIPANVCITRIPKMQSRRSSSKLEERSCFMV